jgi:hypothetical protein
MVESCLLNKCSKKDLLRVDLVASRSTSKESQGNGPAEANMERLYTRSTSFKSIAGIALAGIVVLALLGNLDCAVAQGEDMFCAAAANALGILPCLVLSAWQAIQAYAFDQHRLLECLLQVLLSYWPLLLVVAGAI